MVGKEGNQQLISTENEPLKVCKTDKDYFIIEELLFIHLLKYDNLKNDYVIPDLITQQGISIALDCDRSLISRLLNKNEEEGLIFRKLIKIENKKRRQNAFFLTEKGIEHAFMLTKFISKSNKQDIL